MSDENGGQKRIDRLLSEARGLADKLQASLEMHIEGLALAYGADPEHLAVFDCLTALAAHLAGLDKATEVARSAPYRRIYETGQEMAKAAPLWTLAKSRCDQLDADDAEQWGANDLAFGPLLHTKAPDQADAIMAACADEYRVPPDYRGWVASLVRGVMTEQGGWTDMTIGWCVAYALVVRAILASCDPTQFFIPDGQHRRDHD